jgi:uncharacterized protein
MKTEIVNFIKNNTVLTIATSVKELPYCANCFYVFDEKKQVLIFLSDQATNHIQQALQNTTIAGTINNGVTDVEQIQGVQFAGQFIHPSEFQQVEFYQRYYEKYPFAKNMKAPIWGIKLDWIKMTDNTLGFGSKIEWSRISNS